MVRTTPKIRRMSEGVWDMISAILSSESVREGATTRLTLARDASSNDASRQAAQRVESSNRRPFSTAVNLWRKAGGFTSQIASGPASDDCLGQDPRAASDAVVAPSLQTPPRG